MMRGSDGRSGSLFSYVDLEDRVPAGHPLRVIRRIANDVLAGMSSAFDGAYAPLGRPSIPPERLLRALLLHAAPASLTHCCHEDITVRIWLEARSIWDIRD